ncbi:hypothetical protein H4R34_002209 [Dimargaris verticillata]|uniref:Uncharacterized protein n=1 Tax=Dimargaris verticillata TaxID=2761393 RepID=A0A9W8B4L5_9FUNG|nr:hypothetical protein H4R34_002209 [Dimargaris verticillata]
MLTPVSSLYAECLTNLHSVNVHCALRAPVDDHGHDPGSERTIAFDRQQCCVRTADSSDSLLLPKPVAPPPTRIRPLPLPTSSNSLTTGQQGAVFTFNVADKTTTGASPKADATVPLLLAEHTAPLPAPRLASVDQIYCRWCNQTVAQTVSSVNLTSTFDQSNTLPLLTQGNADQQMYFTATDLPSEHWAELLDCWMCHPDEETKYIVQFDQDVSRPGARLYPWNPSLNQLLVGNTYTLLHPDNIQAQSVQIEPIAQGHQDKNKVHRMVYRLFMHTVVFADSHSPSHTDQWRRRNDVEPIYYGRQQCLEIMTLLTASTLALPPPARTFQTFQVGFLTVL